MAQHLRTVDLATLGAQDAFHLAREVETVCYGDGGETDLDYDLRVCPKLPMPDEAPLAELAGELRRLAEVRRDMQQNAVVEDIVDPDFFPRLLPLNERVRAKGTHPGETARTVLINSPIRGSYTWLPSVVHYDRATRRAKFASPINNLPRTPRNERLYELLEAALTAMLPELLCPNARYGPVDSSVVPPSFSVVVKLQRYIVPPGAVYAGKWHTEGVNENVSSVGVLYTEWPAELEGGALKFRQTGLPDLACYDNEGLEVSVPCMEGTAVVFSNELPHRFQKLTNPTSRPLVRSFVNFFVVNNSLKTTAVVPTNADIYLALGRRLNYDVVGEILKWLQLTPPDWPTALKLRAQAKAEMVQQQGKWGSTFFGNCGDLNWLPNPVPTPMPYPAPTSVAGYDNYDWYEMRPASHVTSASSFAKACALSGN